MNPSAIDVNITRGELDPKVFLIAMTVWDDKNNSFYEEKEVRSVPAALSWVTTVLRRYGGLELLVSLHIEMEL